MAIIETASLPWFKAARFTLGLDVNEAGFRGFYTGNSQRQSTLSDRLTGILSMPSSMDPEEQGEREAVLFSLISAGDILRMPMPQRRKLNGTLGGSTIVASASAAAGARSISLRGCTAGANVFTPAVLSQQWLDGWTTTNCTLAYNSVPGPVAGSLATTITRTAVGNHLVGRLFTLASTSLRSLKFAIWLKSGTYTGNVRIIIADGAAGNQIIKTVALTGGWALEFVAGAFPVSPAANVNVYVDPVDDTGTAGDNFFAWFADLQVEQALMGNAYMVPGAESAPTGQDGTAHHLVRVATGDHFTFRTVTRTVAAGETWTYSAWLRLVSLTGTVALTIADNSGATVATTTVTPTGSWQRFSVTGIFSSAALGVRGLINPANNTGSPGDTLAVYGEQMEPGSSVSDFFPIATLLAGDYIASGGNPLMVALGGAQANLLGEMTVPLALPLPKAIASSAAVIASDVTALWELDTDAPELEYVPGITQGPIVIPLRQVIA